ncbi:MAG TPA: hypothetical protein VHC63_05165 [Acidimicrobiales bacterium]|nr:hypothetical protein [Acidimicrobiales bacterium]
MNYDRTTKLLRLGSGVLVAAGLVAVLLGFLGVRDQGNVELQIPYLMSGGLGGLALIGLGALAQMQAQMRQQEQRMAHIVDELDEWKEAALREVRTFLESAVFEVDADTLIKTKTNGRSRASAN